MKLICFDMDGVIFKDINFWMELHKAFGTLKEGIALTEKYLATDYNKLVEEVVVKLWKGKDAQPYYNLVNSIEYMDGVKQTFTHIKQQGYITAIISASSIDVARRVQHDYGIDHIFANELVIKDGKVTGEFIWPIGIGKEKKAEIIKHLCDDLNISLKDVIYVGDTDIDIEAFKLVGTSVSFNGTESLNQHATHVVRSSKLSAIIPLTQNHTPAPN